MTHIVIKDVVFSRRLYSVAGQERPTKIHRYRRILDQISLEIADGQRVGILGPNGAGKTTLLRLIAGIFVPDEGTIERNSDISALLDSGYGMVDSLTARENCISRLIVSGIPKNEIPAVIDWIEDLTEIGEYFDQPMRTFSNGMFARTIFALAIARPHKVIVIDEGFGLADEYFRRKAQRVLEQLYNDASILVFASHNTQLLKDSCQRGIVLKDGKIAFDGTINDAIKFNHS